MNIQDKNYKYVFLLLHNFERVEHNFSCLKWYTVDTK